MGFYELDTYLGKVQDVVLSEQYIELESASGAGVQMKTANRVETIPQESARRIKQPLSIVAVSLLTNRYQAFCRNGLKGCRSASQELAMKRTRTIKTRMSNSFREHTVCFRMPASDHYCIALWRHDFSDFIYD